MPDSAVVNVKAVDPVRDAARRDPAKTALIAAAETLNWGDLRQRVDAPARSLVAPTGGLG